MNLSCFVSTVQAASEGVKVCGGGRVSSWHTLVLVVSDLYIHIPTDASNRTALERDSANTVLK